MDFPYSKRCIRLESIKVQVMMKALSKGLGALEGKGLLRTPKICRLVNLLNLEAGMLKFLDVSKDFLAQLKCIYCR